MFGTLQVLIQNGTEQEVFSIGLCTVPNSPFVLRTMTTRRFPPPWSVEELDACFVVRDNDGQQLAYVYFEDEPSASLSNKTG